MGVGTPSVLSAGPITPRAARPWLDRTGWSGRRTLSPREVCQARAHRLRGGCLPLTVAFADDYEASLFAGKSLTGWHVMNGGKFEARDGLIQLRGGCGGR